MEPAELEVPEMFSQWTLRKKVAVAMALAGAYLCAALLLSARVAAGRLDGIARAAAENEKRLDRLQAMDQDLARELEIVENIFY